MFKKRYIRIVFFTIFSLFIIKVTFNISFSLPTTFAEIVERKFANQLEDLVELQISERIEIEIIMNKNVSIIHDKSSEPVTTDQYYMVIYFEDENGFMLRVSEEQISIDKNGKDYKVLDQKNELFG